MPRASAAYCRQRELRAYHRMMKCYAEYLQKVNNARQHRVSVQCSAAVINWRAEVDAFAAGGSVNTL